MIFDVDDISVYYGGTGRSATSRWTCTRNEITALIGPSGCGKSTFIRCLNRMNDLIPSRARRGHRSSTTARTSTRTDIDPVQVRKRIGMVFQKPNPFPKSIYDNIAFGPRVMGMKGDMDEIVESALRRGALWDEVKDRLKTNAFGMSGGQQQRLCIARALATEPDVLLMDEPCSALDPISTGRIEDLMIELKQDYSIVIVTHNMQQAARVSDMTAFFTVELHDEGRDRDGRGRRVRRDRQDLHQPRRQAHRGLRHRQVRLVPWPTRIGSTSRRSSPGSRSRRSARSTSWSRRSTARSRRSHHRDIELAAIVIADDDRIDGRYLEVHQGILSLLALQAPVASDLRVVAALLHVIKHAERMGDQCVNIAKVLPITGTEPPVDEEILAQGRADGRARALRGRRSPSRRSCCATSALAEDLVRQDEEINQLNKEIFQRAVEIGDGPRRARVGDDDDARRAGAGADRRQRGRRRRAGRVRRLRAVPRVQRRSHR